MAVLLYIGIYLIILLCILLTVGIYQKNTNRICRSKKRLDGKTTLITGGTRGMGLEIAIDFAQRGARVIVACPFENEGLDAVETIIKKSENKNVVFKNLDLASLDLTRMFAADILKNEDRLDILINNAGLGGPYKAVTDDGLNFVAQVNYFGAFLLTLLLLPLLKKSGCVGDPSRIVNTSSILHMAGRVNINNLNSYVLPFEVYANSKLYLVLFSRELTKRLEGFSVVINNVDPGAVGTTIFSTAIHLGTILTAILWVLFKTPWQGAQTALHVALDRKAGEVSGEFFKNCKLSRAVGRAYYDKSANMLFEESIRLVKLTDKELDVCFG